MGELPIRWVKDELKEQRLKLKNANGANFHKLSTWDMFLNMRKELVAVCEKYAIEAEKHQERFDNLIDKVNKTQNVENEY